MGFTESFEAANGPLTTADQPWTQTDGADPLVIVSNELKIENDDYGIYRCETALVSNHHYAQMRVRTTLSGNPADAQIKLRFDPVFNNSLAGGISFLTHTWNLTGSAGGAAPIEFGQSNVLRFEVRGVRLTLKLDGVVLGESLSALIETGVHVGFLGYKPNSGPIFFTEFEAGELPDPDPPPDAEAAQALTIRHSVLAENLIHSPFKYWQNTDPFLEIGNTVAPKDMWMHEALQVMRVRNAANTAWIGVR